MWYVWCDMVGRACGSDEELVQVPALSRGEAGVSGEAGSSPWEGPLVLASLVTVCGVSPWTMEEREKQYFVS